MASSGVELRNLLALEVIYNQQNDYFTYNDFDVEQVWAPEEDLEDLVTDHPDGKLYVIANPWDEGPNLARCPGLANREVPISFGLQKGRMLTHDVTGIDLLVDLVDELYYMVRHYESADYSWVRTESLKDDNGVPFNYTSLTSHNIFEAYFTVYYNHAVQ